MQKVNCYIFIQLKSFHSPKVSNEGINTSQSRLSDVAEFSSTYREDEAHHLTYSSFEYGEAGQNKSAPQATQIQR